MRNTKAIAMIVLMIASISAGCTGTDGAEGVQGPQGETGPAGADGMDVNQSRITQLEAELASKDAAIAILLANISDMEEELEAVDDVIEMYYMMFIQIQNDINWQNQTRDLRNASLSYAGLILADLTNADLYGADLSGVSWYGATCPDGTNSEDNGNTCVNNI